MLRRTALAVAAGTLVLVAGCSGDDTTIGTPSSTTTPAVHGDSVPGDSVPPDLDVTAEKTFPADRCELNKQAGTITYLSSFDFAASASIVDVVMAKAKGYFDALCLDVVLKPSFSVENYPIVAANDAQFSSAGSFSEMVDFAGANDAGFVALAVEGRTGIDALITKKGAITQLSALNGATIGVKGAITPSVKAMLAQAGLVEGEQYRTVQLDGFDPTVHIQVPDIVGFPGYKSNEPNILRAQGIPFDLFDPSSYDVPGSFGIVYTNTTFLEQHPTAAQDFMRATMRGLADAIADPAAAADAAMAAINEGTNPNFLSADGEAARWKVESKLVSGSTSAGTPPGLPLADLLQREVETYAKVGLFGGVVPDITAMFDASVLEGVYDADGTVIWPAA